MNRIEITKIASNQVLELQKIGMQTFSETFSEVNTTSDMQKYLEAAFSIEKLLSELNNKECTYYFATNNNQVIGYLKLNFGNAQTELQDKNSVELERIYVLKDFLGKNIGKLLFEKAIAIAKSKKATHLWLGVWEKNERAIAFYKKNGFEVFDKHIFVLGTDEQTDIMMQIKLE